jgi:ribosomal protein S12 methylthiotransferase accessory factor
MSVNKERETMEMVISFPGGSAWMRPLMGLWLRPTNHPGWWRGIGANTFLSVFGLDGDLRGDLCPWVLPAARAADGRGHFTPKCGLGPVTHMVTQVNLTIELPPDFPEKYATALIRTAQLCAVKKHLENPPVINVTAHLP